MPTPIRSTTFWGSIDITDRFDDRFDGRTTDIGFPAVSPFEESAVSRVLQLDVNDNLTHFGSFAVA